MTNIPDGFKRSARSSAYLELIGPVYDAGEGGDYKLGLHIDERHTNSRGLCHGALLAAIADVYLGRLIAIVGGRALAPVTTHLGLDYMAPASLGAWLEISGKVDRIGKTLAHSSGIVTADGKPVLRANAAFQVVRLE